MLVEYGEPTISGKQRAAEKININKRALNNILQRFSNDTIVSFYLKLLSKYPIFDYGNCKRKHSRSIKLYFVQ